jgi:hypothetical protein
MVAYPWAGFGTFQFSRDEQPIFGSDTGWARPQPSYSQSRPLGSATDSIVTLAMGSAVRSYEVYLTPTRFTALEALVNTRGLHTDWNRPTPDSRQAFLASLIPQDQNVMVVCDDGVTRRRIRAVVELISQ